MADNNEVLSPITINEYKVISTDRKQKQKLEIAVINDPEFPDLIKKNDFAIMDFDLLYWSDADWHTPHDDLNTFINNAIDAIVHSRPATKAQLLEARNQLIRVFNKILLNSPRMRARNIVALNRTLGSPYTSNTLPELPQNTVSRIEGFISGKTPNTVPPGNNKYKTMTNSVIRKLKNNHNMGGGKRKNKKTRKMRLRIRL
jgi:hypothetical protein